MAVTRRERLEVRYWIRILLVMLLAVASPAGLMGQDQKSGDLDALPSVPRGFAIEFVAREPLVRNPCSLVFDRRGRLFVGMGPQYRNPTPDTPGDSVVLLLDKDGDGVFESRKTFATGFNNIQGLAWHGTDLWVANAPDLTVVRDHDGDDVADEYVLVYTDLGNLEHGLHGLRWGPDGRLYMSKGNSKGLTRPGRVAPRAFRDLWGVSAAEGTPDIPAARSFTPTTYRHAFHDPADDWGREGGVLACDDMGKNLEIVSRGYRNPWDIAFDSGFHFQGTDNDQDEGDRVFNPFYGSHYGWGHPWSSHWTGKDHLPTAPISGPVFHGSGTGMIYYDQASFPGKYRGIWFFNDWLRRTTFFYRPRWQGALLQPHGGQWKEFVTGGDALFKPTDLEIGPEGALYILGWGREYGATWNAQHQQMNEGRIFRVRWQEERTAVALDRLQVKPARQSVAELIADFTSPLPVRRTDAQDELLRRGTRSIAALKQAIAQDSVPTAIETWSAWTLGRTAHVDASLDSYFVEKARQGSLNLRIQSLRILAERQRRGWSGKKLPAVVADSLKDSEARVRFAAVQALRRASQRESVNTLVDQLAREEDRVVFYAGWQALRVVVDATTRRSWLQDERPRVRLAALLSLAEDCQLEREQVEILLADKDDAVRTVAAQWLAKAGGSSVLSVIPPGGEFRDRVNVDRRAGVKPARIHYTLDGSIPTRRSPTWDRSLTLDRSTTLRVAVFSYDQQIGGVAEYRFEKLSRSEAASRSGILSARAKSNRSYVIVDGGLEEGRLAYVDRNYKFLEVPPSLRGAVVVQTANEDEASAGDEFLEIVSVLPGVLFVGHDTRIAKPPRWLAERNPSGFTKTNLVVRTNDATFALYRRKFVAGSVVLGGNTLDGTAGGKSNYLVLIQPAGLPPLPVATTLKTVRPLLSKADPVRGKALFFATNGAGCAKCHRTSGQVQGFGPDLSFLVKQKDPDHVIKSLLNPSLEIKEGFATQWLLTRSGRVVTGLLKSETGGQVELVQPDLARVVVKKDDIEERQSQRVSAMPSFDRLLTPQQVADITAWLLSNPGK